MTEHENSSRRFAKTAVLVSLLLALLLVAAVCTYIRFRPELLKMQAREAAFAGNYEEASGKLIGLAEIDEEAYYESVLAVAAIADYRSDWSAAADLLEQPLLEGGEGTAYEVFAAEAGSLLDECAYHEALNLYQQGDYTAAYRAAASVKGYEPAQRLYQLAYDAYLASLPTPETTPEPTPAPTPAPTPQPTPEPTQAPAPENIVIEATQEPAIEPTPMPVPQALEPGRVSAGYHHTVFLREDGTVYACGDNSCGQLEVGQWQNIVAVAAGAYHTVGLTADGHVLAVGDNSQGQCDVALYSDVTRIAAGAWNTCLLLRSGQVLTAGFHAYEFAAELMPAEEIWAGSYGLIVRSQGKNAASNPGLAIGDQCVQAAVSRGYALGLDENGVVTAAGIELPVWENAAMVSAGENAALALTKDGTVLSRVFGSHVKCSFDFGQPVVALAAGANHYAFVLSDGSLEIRYADGTVYVPEEKLW